jgi:hypothetical protein
MQENFRFFYLKRLSHELDWAFLWHKWIDLFRIYGAINIFLPVNTSLHWLNNVSFSFLLFPLITSAVKFCIYISGFACCLYCTKIGWRCTVFVIFLQPVGSKGRYLKKCPKPCWPIRSKETWTKYTPLTILNQRKLALTLRNTLFALYNHRSTLKILIMDPSPI